MFARMWTLKVLWTFWHIFLYWHVTIVPIACTDGNQQYRNKQNEWSFSPEVARKRLLAVRPPNAHNCWHNQCHCDRYLWRRRACAWAETVPLWPSCPIRYLFSAWEVYLSRGCSHRRWQNGLNYMYLVDAWGWLLYGLTFYTPMAYNSFWSLSFLIVVVKLLLAE